MPWRSPIFDFWSHAPWRELSNGPLFDLWRWKIDEHMTSGLTTAAATSAPSRETHTEETPETAEMHVEKRLKRLSNAWKTPEKRLRSTSAGRWWLVWVSGGWKWVLGSSKATNVASLAVFDPGTNSALSRHLEIHLFVLKSGVASEWSIL
jgi:hypothetical protein